MNKKTIIILVVIIIIGAGIFFFPRKSGSGGTCAGCEIKSCDCLGFEHSMLAIGPVDVTCYGIPYNCTTEQITTSNSNTNQKTVQQDSNMFNWSAMNEGPYRDKVTYATSTDLLNWTPSNVILAEHASVPGAVVKNGTIFVYFVDVSTNGLKEQLGMVKSEDQGQTWSEPEILTIDGLGDKATADPAPVLLADGRIRLYYFDINEPRLNKPASGIEPPQKIYSAISDDGINFTQEQGMRFEHNGAFDPDVEYADGTWYMFVGDLAGNMVNLATASDGLAFEYIGPVYQGGAVPDVFVEGDTWYLYTAGINIATGVDANIFESSGYDFYDPNSHVTADPSVVKLNDGSYLMLYKVQKD